MTIGQELALAAEEGRDDALREVAQRVVDRAIELMPAHDPENDPDPEVNLAEEISIEWDEGGQSLRIVVRGPHAAAHHEAKHWDHPRGGGPKYLERALLEIIPEFPRILATRVRARMNKRVGLGKRIGG